MKVWDHLNSLKPGDPVAVKVLRAGQVVELKAQVPSR